MIIEGYEVEPLTPDRFDDLVHVLGKSGIGGCWCMYWTCPSSAVWGEGTSGGSDGANKQAFREIAQGGPPPGLLAYDGDEAVGWCRVMRRTALPGLANSRYFKTDLDIEGIWSLACFVIRTSHRGRGLTTVLTKAAIEFVRTQGGGVVEAYPTDTNATASPSSIYLGLASTFERLGFEVVQRRAPHKPMMRLTV